MLRLSFQKLILVLFVTAMVALPLAALAGNKRGRLIPRDALTITSVDPKEAVANTSFKITVDGAGFVKGSIVMFTPSYTKTSSELKTTYISANQVTAQYVGTVYDRVSMTVFVMNPDGTKSNGVVIDLKNPSPTLNNVKAEPPDKNFGSYTLTLTGFGFVWFSEVKVDGQVLRSRTADGKTIESFLDPKLVKNPKSVAVTVTNPTPGGGTSKTFTVDLTK